MDLLLTASAAPQLGPRVGRSWTRWQPLALVPNTWTDKAPGLPLICLCYKTRDQAAGQTYPEHLLSC